MSGVSDVGGGSGECGTKASVYIKSAAPLISV